ncbi:uncharacterized protein LOC144376226 [Ictidomys tridecemlineatus]
MPPPAAASRHKMEPAGGAAARGRPCPAASPGPARGSEQEVAWPASRRYSARLTKSRTAPGPAGPQLERFAGPAAALTRPGGLQGGQCPLAAAALAAGTAPPRYEATRMKLNL